MKKDLINHPPHYTYSEIEAIEVIEAWNLDFCLGQVVKYICRRGRKKTFPVLQDLKKAQWYLNRKIQQLEDK